MTGETNPNSGKVYINGTDIFENPNLARSMIG